jgi:signal peptidase II
MLYLNRILEISNKGLAAFILSVLVLLDQLSKLYIHKNFSLYESKDFLINILELKYVRNTGIAFGMFAEHSQLIFTLVSLVVLAFLIISFTKPKLELGFIFIFAGALGNLIDRILYGFVIDFINPTFVDFAVFNLADAFLNIGVFLIIMQMFITKKI